MDILGMDILGRIHAKDFGLKQKLEISSSRVQRTQRGTKIPSWAKAQDSKVQGHSKGLLVKEDPLF